MSQVDGTIKVVSISDGNMVRVVRTNKNTIRYMQHI